MIEQLIPYFIAWAIWALVGSDRELLKSIATTRKGGIIFAGIRSYTFIAVLGALLTELDVIFDGGWFFIAIWGVLVSLLVLSAYIYSSWNHTQYGLTSEISTILVYFLWVLVMAWDVQVAVIISVLMTIILASREQVGRLFHAINKEELTTTLKFAVIAFIILPLLPNDKFSFADMLGIESSNPVLSMDFFNPYGIWFFVVLMSGISYIGYILSRFVGAGKGIGVSGAIWGLVSSTAVTSSMSDQSKKHTSIVYPFVFGTLLANLIMFIRVIFIVFVFNIALLKVLFIPIGVMLLTLGGCIYYAIWKSRNQKVVHKDSDNPEFRSPFQIGPALKFAAFIVAIKFFSGLALIYQDFWWEYALYAVSFFSGFADVDAITQDMSVKSLDESIVAHVATTAIIIAVITNTVVKMSIAKLFWGKKYGNIISMALALVSIIGLLSLFLVY